MLTTALLLLYYCFTSQSELGDVYSALQLLTTALLLPLYYCFTSQSELGDVYSVRFNLASTAGTCVFTTASLLLLTRQLPLYYCLFTTAT